MARNHFIVSNLQPATQHAALCFRMSGAQVEILLVTSRDTGRWVLPKGWPMKGEEGGAAALREAFEEAGVVGRPQPGCIGVYTYLKSLPAAAPMPCVVTVHGVRVDHLAWSFPERGRRQLRWFRPDEAAANVAEPELQALLAAFRPPGQHQTRAESG